jgi:peptidoglycan/xylan/chitin deacetylase (PgdA/CDA1 family)
VSERKSGFLTPEDVCELASLPGATIGSHSVHHPHLSTCDDLKLKTELSESKAYLEDLLGNEITHLSYPHGSVNRRVRDMAENIGYRIGATSRFDINQSNRNPLLLCRSLIEADDTLAILEQKLQGDWDWNRWRSMNIK